MQFEHPVFTFGLLLRILFCFWLSSSATEWEDVELVLAALPAGLNRFEDMVKSMYGSTREKIEAPWLRAFPVGPEQRNQARSR